MALRKQYSYLLIANGLVALATIIINALIPRMYSVSDLSDFILIKRIITTALSIQLIGMNISIPYFYPRVKNIKVYHDAVKLFITVTIPTILIIGLFISWAGFFNNESIGYRSYLLFSVVLSFNTMTFSIIRSLQNFRKAAIQHSKNMFLYPVVCLVLTHSLSQYFLVLFIISIIDNTLTIWRILSKHAPESDDGLAKRVYDTILLAKYGIQRFPMFITQIFIAALPLLYLKSVDEIERIAVWGAALTILRLVIMLAGPINTIVLPRYSALLAVGYPNVREEVWKINIIALMLGAPLMLFLYYFLNPMIELWIGVDTSPYMVDTMIISFTIPFMLGSELVRSTVDAIQTRSLNSYIYIISVIIAASIVLIMANVAGFSLQYILIYLILVYTLIYIFSGIALHHKIKFRSTQIYYLVAALGFNFILILFMAANN